MKPAVVNGRWTVQMTDAQADWDVWSYWEAERFRSMADHLKPGDVLFDVGAEFGSISAVYAQMVGGENMVLFEPSPLFWPNIRQTWEANGLALPRACWAGLVGERVDDAPPDLDFDATMVDGWPACAWGDDVQDAAAYRYLFDHAHQTPTTTLDAWSIDTGIIPTAITIDVEGAELAVLRGAEQLLDAARPMVFLSVHPDLLARDFGATEAEVHDLMRHHDYVGEHLGTDHEAHWKFVVDP